jgi:hypothetical protein
MGKVVNVLLPLPCSLRSSFNKRSPRNPFSDISCSMTRTHSDGVWLRTTRDKILKIPVRFEGIIMRVNSPENHLSLAINERLRTRYNQCNQYNIQCSFQIFHESPLYYPYPPFPFSCKHLLHFQIMLVQPVKTLGNSSLLFLELKEILLE